MPIEGHVLKGLSGIPSYVLDAKCLECTEGGGPYFIQKFVSGTEYRIHVIDDNVFAHRLSKPDECVDYRISGLSDVTYTSVDPVLADISLRLTRSEGLRFSGIDVIMESKTIYVLEVNSMPGYHTFEVNGGPPYKISDTLYSALCS